MTRGRDEMERACQMYRLVAALLARMRRRRDDQPTDVEVLVERHRRERP